MAINFSSDLSGLRDELLSGLSELRKEVAKESKKVGQAIGDGYEDGYEESVEEVRKSKEELLRELEDAKRRFEKNLNKFPDVLKKFFKTLNTRDLTRTSGALNKALNDMSKIKNEFSEIGESFDIGEWLDSMKSQSEELFKSLGQQASATQEVVEQTQELINTGAQQAKKADVVTGKIQKQTGALKQQTKAANELNAAQQKQLNMASAIKRYNKLMNEIGKSHLTIGQPVSEGTSDVNIKDMVGEAQRQIDESYSAANRPSDKAAKKDWESQRQKLIRFVNAYRGFVNDISSAQNRLSQTDNVSAVQTETKTIEANTASVEKNIKAKQKASKIKFRDLNADEYDELSYEEKDIYEVVDMLRSASKYGTQYAAQLTTSCKRAETAIKRLFSAIDLEKYPQYKGWQEAMLESVSYGSFKEIATTTHNVQTGDYAWAVEDLGEDRFYVYLNLLDVAADKQEAYVADLEEKIARQEKALERQSKLVPELYQKTEQLVNLRKSKPDASLTDEIIKYYEQESELLSDVIALKKEYNNLPLLNGNRRVTNGGTWDWVSDDYLQESQHHLMYYQNMQAEEHKKLADATKQSTEAYLAAQQKLAERAKNLKSGSEKSNFGKGRIYSGKEGRLTLATSLANDLSQFDLTNDELNDLVAKTYEQFSKVRDLLVDKETWAKQMSSALNEHALGEQLNATYQPSAIRSLVKDAEFVSYFDQARDGIISIEEAMERIDVLARNSGLAQYIKQADDAVGDVQEETKAIAQNTDAVEKNVKVKQQRLKLTKTEGGYTAVDGQYKITKGDKDDAYKWYVAQRDASGNYSAWDGFDSLNEIRSDEFLIAQQEVVSQLKALNMFEMPSGQISMFDGMTESAEKATVAVKELNDVTQEATIIPGQIGLDELEKKFDKATKLIEAQRKKYGDAFDGMYQDMFDSLGELNYANAEAIINEMNSRIDKRFRDQRQKIASNIVYHAGDLSNISNTLKSFPLGNVPPHMSTGIGGLTGLYTTEDIDGFWGNEWSGAPISTIDISGYKLLNARVDELAEAFGGFLNDLNATIYGYCEVMDEKEWNWTRTDSVKSIDELYAAHKELFRRSTLSIEQFADFIKSSSAKITGKAFKEIELVDIDQGIAKSGVTYAIQDAAEELFQSDSFKTQFLKLLGYEGVDLRGTKYGGTYTGGTVLFDPKQESIVETNAMWSDVMRKHGYEIDESSLEMEKKRRQLALDTAKAYSKQADASKETAVSTSQMLDAIMDSIEAERKNVEAAADALSESRKGIGQAYSGVVYHGSKAPLSNVTFDPNSGDGFRNLGTGMYYTPELQMASEYGKNIVQTTVDLKNVFMLVKDSISSIDDLYAAMGREVPKNPDWDTITSDLGVYLTSIENVRNFSQRMQKMGYDGIFSRGYGFGSDDEHSEQLVVYDEKYWKNLTTVPYQAIEAAASDAVDAQQKLVQANEEVMAAADKATQQIEEQTTSLREQSEVQPKATTNLTASEYQAAFGGGDLDKLLSGFNITGRAASGIADIATDAMRGQKMMIEGSQSDDMELLNAGAQLFSESVRKVSAEVMNLGSTVDGTDDVLKDFYTYMSGKRMRYDDSYKAEFGGKKEWNATRARFHNVLTQDVSGIPVDTLYQEILELFPGLFDKDVINEKDQLVSILNMLGAARDAKKNNWQKTLPIHGSLEEVQGEVASVFMNMGSAMEKRMQSEAKLAAVEKTIADAAAQTTGELEKQNAERQKAVDLDDQLDSDDGEVSAQKIIERSLKDAINQLRTAQNNETTLFSLKDVKSGEGLVDEARSFVDQIAEEANLKLGKFTVKDNIIQAQLYNDELKVVVDQTYRLQQATEETEAALELIGQSFSQNVKALNANNFDVDGVRAKATAAVKAVKASLHGTPYDLTELDTAAKNITSQDDFKKFQNQLDAAKKSIQAISSSIESPDTMNPLVSMQRNMRKANTELETMQLNLKKFGNIEGVQKANDMITDMRKAVEAFNNAKDVDTQRQAYNTYSGLKGQLDAQIKYLNAAKTAEAQNSASWKVYAQDGYKYTGGKTADDQLELDRMRDYYKQQETDAQQFTDNIKSTYHEMLRIVEQIDKLDIKMNDLAFKDQGTGLYSGIIENLRVQKSYLLADLENLRQSLGSALNIDPQGEENVFAAFLSDARVQAALTVEEIQNLQKAFMSTEDIQFNFAAKLAQELQPVLDKVTQLQKLIREGAITDTGIINGVNAINRKLHERSDSSDPDMLRAKAMELLQYANAVAEGVTNTLNSAKKEMQYFQGKQKVVAGETYDTAQGPTISELSVDAQGTDTIKTKKQLLEEFVAEFGKGKAVITDFTQTANGINKINFTIFDEVTHQFRTFTAEMGKMSNDIYKTETSMKNLSAGTDAAKKAYQSLEEMMARLNTLDSSGLDVSGAIGQLTALENRLSQAMRDVGDSKDVGKQIGLKNLAAEVQKTIREIAKLENQWTKTQQAIDEDPDINLGAIDKTGDKYAQMYAKIRAAAGDATISNQKFDDTTNTLTYTLTEADGKVVQMTAHMDALTGTVTTQEGKVGQLRTAWGDVATGLKGVGKDVLRYAANLFQVMDIVRYMRTGFNAVLAIDTALTELRKVTDETDATYSKFLQTMSKTGAVVGSTVKDLTTSASDWARLGYDLEQAGRLAENTMVLMNVSEFDNVTDATDTLISAIQAFKDEDMNVGDFSMDIIDVFNQIGKIIA